jgi:hypothetical protein
MGKKKKEPMEEGRESIEEVRESLVLSAFLRCFVF